MKPTLYSVRPFDVLRATRALNMTPEDSTVAQLRVGSGLMLMEIVDLMGNSSPTFAEGAAYRKIQQIERAVVEYLTAPSPDGMGLDIKRIEVAGKLLDGEMQTAITENDSDASVWFGTIKMNSGHVVNLAVEIPEEALGLWHDEWHE